MNSTLPPDPYKLLGVTKEAKLPEIRSAHRKLVLKCHPDKVQDATLKAIKQDEFQKVQQAYELLSDDTKRLQYDEQVKLFELRKEMGRGNPTPRSNPFEYEVKTAEPRPNSYGRPKVYSYPTTVPRSNEDLYEEPRHMPRKSASNESASERKRAAMREEERYRESAARKQQEDERLRQREKDRESKRAHSEKKKSRDKDRRKGTEEKVRSRTTYVEDDSSDDDYRASAARAAEKKASRHRMEEEIRMREEAAQAVRAEAAARAAQEARASIKEAPMTDKWSEHRDFAGKYMQAARRKVAVETEHPGMRRAETFSASSTPAYNVRYAAPQPQFSDDDLPRRSSAPRKEPSRRSSDTPAIRTDKSSRRRSPPASHPNDPYIVDAPSPTSAPRKPPLQSFSSAPPVFTRETPSRSKTQDYPRKEAGVPPLPRAQTFQAGDRGRERSSGSKLRKEVYTSDEEADSPIYSPRHSHSPPRRAPEPTRYIVENGRTIPVTSRPHRSELRNVDGGYTRERSESPHGTPSRPPISRNPPSSERPRTATRSTSYYQAPEAPEPIVLTARPKLAREGSSHRGSSRNTPGTAYFENVQYRPKYSTDDVIYANHPGAGLYETGRRGSESRDYYQPHQRGGAGVYA